MFELRKGGTSSIFVNDDGLQLLPEEERNERIQFYATHGIGWVARPPHSEETPRAGTFKKVPLSFLTAFYSVTYPRVS